MRLLPGALAAVGLGVCGCPPPPPLQFGAGGPITDPKIAVDSIIARREKIHSVKGEAKVSLSTPQGSGKITEFIAAEWPNRLRLETVSFFGSPLAVLTTDGVHFQLLDVEHNHFTQGVASRDDASRLLPVPLNAEIVVALLLGVPPLLDAATQTKLVVDEKARSYALTLKHGDAIEVVGLDTITLRPVWVRMNADASPTAFEARFAEYDPDTDLPRSMELRTRDPDTSVELKWRDREINSSIPPETFVQQPPQ
jgi:outer membrane lipoprotein-sorting protein